MNRFTPLLKLSIRQNLRHAMPNICPRLSITAISSRKFTTYKPILEHSHQHQQENPAQGKMLIAFTCKVCNHRTHKTFSKKAYTEGVVLIQCPSCENRHLIADNLGWFRDNKVNIEDLMNEKGEDVKFVKGNGDLLADEWVPNVVGEENEKVERLKVLEAEKSKEKKAEESKE
ncbi:zf-DNL-domain-containing protein [Conidiobolus coronatus NRRL 28638]|uniref:Zf-DNL-domain-containing protein n=1 Tax=Conidiobolus coronatus (strain ATCC 28846 / CBS 209.66 / NRRL 28638) TaxID=796925 RepID=A0A137P049_CONC2|nr:zf-DNL-domain-containing protein [Conidiobolus coronatus NRRL 28638]|eukprot:KXN68338.1 zf-DNL-domain-containing protein [Conidiobolus coronatus NRRL 28638]